MSDDTKLARVNGFLPWIGERIKGQPEVLAVLDAHFGRSELGLTEPGHIRGGFLFVGPTGVGKTESTLLCGDYFFGADSVARLNMSEFKEARHVSELRERLAKAKSEGKRIYLVDEIEKAHWEVLDLFLQFLDKGARVAAPDGSLLDFTDSYLVMTSNLGTREAMRSRTKNYTSFSNTVMEYVRRYLRPELLGRIEAVGTALVFRRLEEPQQRELARFHVESVLHRMRSDGYTLSMGPDGFEHLMRNGFSEEYGARRLVGVIRKSIEGAVSDALRHQLPASGLLTERADGNGLRIVSPLEHAA